MRVLWILLLVVPLAGCTGEGGNDCAEWHCREGYEDDPTWRETNIPARTALEMDFALNPGDTLPWDWFQPDHKHITFEMHFHRPSGADETVFQHREPEDQDSYVAEEANTYSLLWINEGQEPLKLWVQVEGEICYGEGGTRCGSFIPL